MTSPRIRSAPAISLRQLSFITNVAASGVLHHPANYAMQRSALIVTQLATRASGAPTVRRR
jgi:hypothetical protein